METVLLDSWELNEEGPAVEEELSSVPPDEDKDNVEVTLEGVEVGVVWG